MALRYTYKVYDKFPEATEISESRERGFACLSVIHGLTLIASIICLVVDFSETWPMIFLGIASILSFIYLIYYYPSVTEKKIQKAIEKRKKMLQEISNSKYTCKFINCLNDVKSGKCQVCFTYNDYLGLYKVKNDIGMREIYLCQSCASKYKENSK